MQRQKEWATQHKSALKIWLGFVRKPELDGNLLEQWNPCGILWHEWCRLSFGERSSAFLTNCWHCRWILWHIQNCEIEFCVIKTMNFPSPCSGPIWLCCSLVCLRAGFSCSLCCRSDRMDVFINCWDRQSSAAPNTNKMSIPEEHILCVQCSHAEEHSCSRNKQFFTKKKELSTRTLNRRWLSASLARDFHFRVMEWLGLEGTQRWSGPTLLPWAGSLSLKFLFSGSWSTLSRALNFQILFKELWLKCK